MNELIKVKNQLKDFKTTMKEASDDFSLKEFKWERMQGSLKSINPPESELITLNVGGEIFKLSKSTFMKYEDSLLFYIVNSGEFDLKEEIFIDRDPKYFNIIIDYYLNSKINYSQFKSKQEFNIFRREVEFYQLTDVLEFIENQMKEVKFVGFTFSSAYLFNGKMAGTNIIEDILHPDGVTGICCKSPGWIIIELNNIWEFEQLEIGGYRGSKELWFFENGVGAEISVSLDQLSWTLIGKIPIDFGKENKIIKFLPSKARYIKFNSTANIGIGYLRIIKKDLIEEEKEQAN